MKSVTTIRFRKCYSQLPNEIQLATKKAYKLWQLNPYSSGLDFKKIHSGEIYSIRVTLSYRALAIKEEDVFIWFWIGSHSDYDKMIA